jgi:hypothetical protein
LPAAAVRGSGGLARQVFALLTAASEAAVFWRNVYSDVELCQRARSLQRRAVRFTLSSAHTSALARVMKVGAEVRGDVDGGLPGRVDEGRVQTEYADDRVVPRPTRAPGRHGVARHVHHASVAGNLVARVVFGRRPL